MNSARVEIKQDALLFNQGTKVTFQRTLRIPDDGSNYPLPPGLGCFPLRRVDDYLDKVPPQWRDKGGVFMPMFQREAMWLCFSTPANKPRAAKVAVGKINAITGAPWSEALSVNPQDYLVTPPQPWLDGIYAGSGTIRQFVAMPLGMGYTVEGQVTGQEHFGGVQIKVFEPRPGCFPDRPHMDIAFDLKEDAEAPCCVPQMSCKKQRAGSMGVAAGGRMKQKVYPDPHGISTWDGNNTSRVFVHIVNSALWREITGENPPTTPVTARSYTSHGLPWFDLYDECLSTLHPTDTLGQIQSVKQMDQHKFGSILQDDDPVKVGPVKKVATKVAKMLVRDGKW